MAHSSDMSFQDIAKLLLEVQTLCDEVRSGRVCSFCFSGWTSSLTSTSSSAEPQKVRDTDVVGTAVTVVLKDTASNHLPTHEC